MAIAYLVLTTVMLLTGACSAYRLPPLELVFPALLTSTCQAANTPDCQPTCNHTAIWNPCSNAQPTDIYGEAGFPHLRVHDKPKEMTTARILWTWFNVAVDDTYREESVEGWTLRINKALTERDQAAVSQAVDLLRAQLQEIKQQVPAAAVRQLQTVPLWFSPEYPDIPPRAEYHPDEGWLRNHDRNPEMARGIEFTNIRIFAQESKRMPNFALHELAHAYHHQFLTKGFDNPEIIRAFAEAKREGLYESVEQRFGDGRSAQVRGYALTNEAEYFAETTEALFSTNDFFPFRKEQLQRYDPRMFAVLRALWQVE